MSTRSAHAASDSNTGHSRTHRSSAARPSTPPDAPYLITPASITSPYWGPTRLTISDLLDVTARAANEVGSGHRNDLLPEDGGLDSERWFRRIHGDDELDVWLIRWVFGRTTELHDHGGSLGALTVLSGSLSEMYWDGSRLRRRRLDSGDRAGFPLGWVHDVVWAPSSVPETAESLQAVRGTFSVHAYAPPLTTMSYYDVTDRNSLLRKRSELTTNSERHGE
jgi:hypothetical protein